MDQERIEGAFDWYAGDKGFGVIRGNDGKEYFAHESQCALNLAPAQGVRVSFLARPRRKGKEGLEAYEIRSVAAQKTGTSAPPQPASSPKRPLASSATPPNKPSPMPTTQAPKPPVTPRDSTSDISKAAQEALRLRRERQLGRIPDRLDDLAPGTRVMHPVRGAGTVQLASRNTISVRFDNDPRVTVDLPRDDSLRKITDKAATASAPPQASVPVTRAAPAWSFRAGMNIGDLIRSMANDVKERLTEEGLDTNGVWHCEESQDPPSPPLPLTVHSRVARAFETVSGITTFYSHQVEAREALLAGKHVVICTPTASGKTEAYNPTILETLLRDPQATALYVFPLVALGEDQTGRLNKLNNALPLDERLTIGIYNGSVAEDEKKEMLRRENRILVTTPDSLHYIFLPKPYPNWQRFYRNLRYVVLDEAHVYRGVLGANMANIVRRLLVRCRRLGNPRFPQIIISSATVRRPDQLAQQLTGLPAEQFEVIKRSGSPRSKRHYLVTRSDIHELDEVCADLLEVTTIDARTGKKRPVKTIVFLGSIRDVKRSTEKMREHLRKTRRSELASCVEEYYADKGDKNDVLARLRDPDGTLRCVFATTALMAGIDIGGLDVAIVKGFPGLVMDARQMFGRAGRVGEGAAIFIANRTDPFDQFYFERPQDLFEGPTEEVVANPENPYLLAAHLKCAAQTGTAKFKNQEGPLSGRWVDLFGTMGKDLLDSLVDASTLRIRSGSYYLDDGEPHDQEPLTSIRAIQSETYILRNLADGSKLEEKRKATAYRDAHPGAIVWCNGEKYKVLDLHEESREIKCSPEPNSNQRTEGIEERNVEILEVNSITELPWTNRSAAEVTLGNGEVRITTTVPKYRIFQVMTVMQCRSRRCRHETPVLSTERCPKCGGPVRAKQTEKVIEKRPIVHDPPLSYTLTTRATWLDFSVSTREQFDREFWPRWSSSDGEEEAIAVGPAFLHAVHSLEHAMLKAFPEHIRCDRDEIGGIYLLNSNNLAARVFIYDNFPGGLGLADDFSQDALPVIQGALNLIERCTCYDEEGCPVCLARYGCRSFNTMLSKLGGRYLLSMLTGKDTGPVIRDLSDYVETCVDPDCIVERPTQSEVVYGGSFTPGRGASRG